MSTEKGNEGCGGMAGLGQAGRDGADPHPQVGALSYRLVMACQSCCSPLVWESISVHLWYSASCKSPQGAPRQVLAPRSLIEKSFLAGRCQERNYFGRGEGREFKNEKCVVPSAPPPPPPHTIPFTLVTAQLFPDLGPFF